VILLGTADEGAAVDLVRGGDDAPGPAAGCRVNRGSVALVRSGLGAGGRAPRFGGSACGHERAWPGKKPLVIGAMRKNHRLGLGVRMRPGLSLLVED